MSSFFYDEGLYQAVTGGVDFNTDTIKVMLVTSDYAPNKATHLHRSDVTDEVAGAGYAAGGSVAAVTMNKDTANNRVDASLAASTWGAATITARGAVYYKSTGVAANDTLIAYIDFGADISSTVGNFDLTASILRLTN